MRSNKSHPLSVWTLVTCREHPFSKNPLNPNHPSTQPKEKTPQFTFLKHSFFPFILIFVWHRFLQKRRSTHTSPRRPDLLPPRLKKKTALEESGGKERKKEHSKCRPSFFLWWNTCLV
ncbi:hypothetical protein CDAR_437861 [Caerostris darwini]|uniref:Uncharacterized protein n=1 Tax=Caerostris darwini TaxID=1538125 RepID=A0AAV4NT93_9ARAC|nr:hypothetical protein CDAR_437861 [Caerostris darwini]